MTWRTTVKKHRSTKTDVKSAQIWCCIVPAVLVTTTHEMDTGMVLSVVNVAVALQGGE